MDVRSPIAGAEAGRKRGLRWLSGVLPPVIFLALVLAAWQLYCVIVQPRPDLYPSVFDVFGAFGFAWDAGQMQRAIITSLGRGALGFLFAVAIGTALGLLLAEVSLLRRAMGPIISGLQVLPSVAWVPAAILWFGLSDATVYFVVLMGAVPSIANGVIDGLHRVPEDIRRAGVVMGANRWEMATRILFPAALPAYISGLKQGWAFSWRSLMAAEIIATGGSLGFGLGSLLQQNRELADLAGVLATVLTILAMGILIELAGFAPIERRILRGRGLALPRAR